MRAAAFMEFGGPEVLRVIDVPQPVAGAGELVVAVVASPVNPTDTLMRAGRQAASMQAVVPPYITGVEFAGYVHGVGDPGASFAVGQAVMGLVDARRPGGGSHAEYVRVSARSVADVPPSVDIAGAATVPMNGLTAILALEAAGLQRGDTLLITGGAGAVGGYALQLARHAGLRVITDAKQADVETVRERGADIVIARGEGMEADLRRHCPRGVDGLIDCALLGDRAAALVRDGGTGVTLRKSNPIRDPRLQHRSVSVFETPDPAPYLRRLAEFLRDGLLVPRGSRRLPLEAAAEAHRLVEQGGLRESVVLSPRVTDRERTK